MKWALRAALGVVAAALLALVLANGLSTHFASLPGAVAASRALTWNSRQPEALARIAENVEATEPTTAEQLLVQAVKVRPVAVEPLLALARLADRQEDTEQADRLIAQATALEPADPDVLLAAGEHWAKRGQPERAVELWSAAVTADPTRRDEVFPVFLAIAEDPDSRLLLRPVAANPPEWWNRFFAEVARRALDVETVRTLYALRQDAIDAPFTLEERRAYIARLRRDALVTEAYLVWINGLDDGERQHLGLLHNGGFEKTPTNAGFDWHLRAPKTVMVNTAATYGADGQRSLHVVFQDTKQRFGHVNQPLFLDQGRYRFSGRVRTDSLQARGGVKWLLRCAPAGEKQMQTLGESERFLGASEWRDFTFEFMMPPDCENQEVRLASADYRPGEKLKGSLWFDSLRIRRLGDLPPVEEPTVTADAAAGTEPQGEQGETMVLPEDTPAPLEIPDPETPAENRATAADLDPAAVDNQQDQM